jgi:hypothetical protein
MRMPQFHLRMGIIVIACVAFLCAIATQLGAIFGFVFDHGESIFKVVAILGLAMWVVMVCVGLWGVIWIIGHAKSYTPSLLAVLGFPILAVGSLYAFAILLGILSLVLIQT